MYVCMWIDIAQPLQPKQSSLIVGVMLSNFCFRIISRAAE